MINVCVLVTAQRQYLAICETHTNKLIGWFRFAIDSFNLLKMVLDYEIESLILSAFVFFVES